jgi:alpha-L-arabinofuranosidase
VQWSLANAIFHADAFGQFAENGVSVATLFTFQECPFGLIRGWNRGEGYGGERWDEKTVRPKAFALQLFSKYFGDILLEKKVEGGLTYTKHEDWWPSSYTGQVPYVSAYAAKRSDTGVLTVALINKHASSPIEMEIVFEEENETQKECIVTILSGPGVTAQNDGSPGNVSLKESLMFVVGKVFSYNLPPHSVVMLELREKESKKGTVK